MIVCGDFVKLIGNKIKRILFVAWPPVGEKEMLSVDISLALEFSDSDRIFHIRIDKDDCWTPIVSEANFDKVYQWYEFQPRIKGWMTGRIDQPLQNEIFDATSETTFENITIQEILDIECVSLKSEFNPFAVKIKFAKDFILVSPVSDGTTTETARFNRLENLETYREIDELEYIPIRSVTAR